MSTGKALQDVEGAFHVVLGRIMKDRYIFCFEIGKINIISLFKFRIMGNLKKNGLIINQI